MTEGINPLAATMINQLNRVDTISNNIANVNTVGFKQNNLTESSFNSYLDEAISKNKKISKMSEVINTTPKITGHYLDNKLGSIKQTTNKLDFAITKEDTYFKIQNQKDEVEYTRNGSFKVLDGFLVTQNGDKVLNRNDYPVKVINNKGKDIVDFKFNIALVKIDSKNLQQNGNNHYKVNNVDNVEDIAKNNEYLKNGYLESSNVNSMISMVSLIDAQRRFEQAQKAISAIDTLNGKVIDSLGNGR